ncbi:MAG TPA: hypothetical protein VME86_01160 [Acidobacteriaceae bacterium]|nr:hypothetical protein [Acidobacteriaceae bacterium]
MEKRYNEVDSLRGLAASTVVLGHLADLSLRWGFRQAGSAGGIL